MWITTLDGYFSIVHYPDHGADNLVIRARTRADLEALACRMPEMGPIKDTPAQDYPARATAPREAVGRWLANEAMQVDYPNFKAAVAKAQGKQRALVYGQVWAALLGIQGERPRPRGNQSPRSVEQRGATKALDDLCKQVAARVPYVIDHPRGGSRILGECFPFEGKPDLNMLPGLVFADTFWYTNDVSFPFHTVDGVVTGAPPVFTIIGSLGPILIRQIWEGDPIWAEWKEWLGHLRANPNETTANAKATIMGYSW